jgi:ketosteroid isomerase-like protein
VRQYFADADRVWEEFSLHAADIRAAAGGVVVFGEVRGRVKGQPVRRRVVWVWQVSAGKAVSMRVSDIGDLEEG